MARNSENKYRSSGSTAGRSGDELITRGALWAALAQDYGAFNANKQKKGTYEIIGFNDLGYLDDDLLSLSKSEKVKEPDLGAIKAANTGQASLRLEERLCRALPVYLSRLIPGVRPAEQFHAVYEMAARQGYLGSHGNATSKHAVWQGLVEGSDKQAHEFLTELQRHYRSDGFLDLIAHRENLAERDLNEQWSLAGTILARHDRVHVMVVDLGVHQASIPWGSMSLGYKTAGQQLMECARQLMGHMKSEASILEQCLGAIAHAEFNQDLGFYLRFTFLIVPGEFGFRQQFQARVFRLWQAIAGHGGWMQDRRGHQNKIVGGLGVVSAKDDASILRLQKSLYYGVKKDLCMRVDVGISATFITAAIQPMHFGLERGFLPFHRDQA